MASGINKFIRLLSIKNIYRYYKRSKDLKKYNSLSLPLIYNIDKSTFGKYVLLNSNVSIVNSHIDDHSYVNNNTKIKNTKIGKFCSIGANVDIVLGGHPIDFVSTHPAFYSDKQKFKTFSDKTYIKEFENVVIGNDVWIGKNVIIPGGIYIGNGAVIASGAVVTKDVEAYSVVGGVPAKFIKYRFEKETRTKIEQSRWWNKPEVFFENNFKDFMDVDVFLSKTCNL
jgi:acetyltransferase-like isoleucine patch superfamily enzyme